MHRWSDLVAAVRVAVTPAPALKAVTLAQWALESGRGSSELSVRHGNFAGLKWRPEMEGYATKISYGAHDGVGDYCAFASLEAFIVGYWRFIGRDVYSGWRAYASDPAGFVAFLASRGYAADRAYVGKVLAILPEMEDLLEERQGEDRQDPNVERPSRSELGETISDRLTPDQSPEFVTLSSIAHRYRGLRPGGLEGAIVHYDAGRVRPRAGRDDPEWGAKNCLEGAVKNGFAYATISRTGKIYLPGNMDWNRWGYHAGESTWPGDRTKTGVSQFLVGFEVNCPGYLDPTEDPDVFVPWFNAVRNSQGRVILNAKGQATVVNARDVTYKRSEIRLVARKTGNIKPGAYVPYTDQQFKAIVNVMLWLKRNFPRTFRLDNVFGHDEVSPDRKLDPGGSLGETPAADAMTMAQLRSVLLKAWADQQLLVA